MRLRLPRRVSALLAVLLLMAALGGISFYGVNQASNSADQLPRYTLKVREKITKLVRKTQRLEGLTPDEVKSTPKAHDPAAPNFADLLTRGFGSATEVLFAGSFIPFLVFFMLT